MIPQYKKFGNSYGSQNYFSLLFIDMIVENRKYSSCPKYSLKTNAVTFMNCIKTDKVL